MSSCDWLELPQDLLGLITDKLISSLSLTEYIRFGSVCTEWRSFSIQNYEHIKLPSNLPLLLIPIPSTSTDHHHHQQQNIPSPPSSTEDEEDYGVKDDFFNPNHIWLGHDAKERYKNTRTFYSLSEKRVYHDFPLSIPYYKNIRGSSHGWLVTVEECYHSNGEAYYPVRLLNPFRTAGNNNNNEIQLPPLTRGSPTGNIERWTTPYHSYYMKKICLSANPSSLSLSDLSTELVVLGVYQGYNLGFCRPGDKVWTHLEVNNNIYPCIMHITFYKGQFYAVLSNGDVFSFVFDATELNPNLIVKVEMERPREDNDPNHHPNKRYLVESAGDLLQVKRGVTHCSENGNDSYTTTGFRVFKLDESTNKWVERKNLDGRMLFLGTNGSMSLSAIDFPGCKPNSIYFTDDYDDIFYYRPLMGPHDIGVFNLEDGSFEPHYELESKTIMPPPFWIQPML